MTLQRSGNPHYTICTSSTHPSNPIVGDSLFETDTGLVLYYQGATDTWTKDWGTAWGVLGYVQVTASQGSITAAVDLTSLTLTTTFIANRRIKLSGQIMILSTVGTDQLTLLITDSTPTTIIQANNDSSANSQNVVIASSIVVSPAAGSKLYKLRASRTGTGTATMLGSATIPSWFMVEDIGPNGNPS